MDYSGKEPEMQTNEREKTMEADRPASKNFGIAVNRMLRPTSYALR
jgi:hypothetical protein